MKFDELRASRMASMNYVSKDMVILHSSQSSPSGGLEDGDVGLNMNKDKNKDKDHSEHDKDIHSHRKDDCTSYDVHWVGAKDEGRCFAVVKVQGIDSPYPVQRYDRGVDENGKGENDRPEAHHPLKAPFRGNEHNEGHKRPVGFFRKIPAFRGFARTKDKLGPFVQNFDGPAGIENQLSDKLHSHNIKRGDDVTLMVVNEGEIDLWLNFACSCQQNRLRMDNVVVFAGSPEIVPLIEATGAMGLYNKGYAAVSRKASNDYLDRVFVDMMWYKAFSVHLLTRLGINVLFQDVDLVWFRDPFPWFKNFTATHSVQSHMSGSHPEAFFSDDGQRSLRYSPFFANSGFYYLLGTPRSAYFSWSIMTAFDAVQVLGSHQNVFTYRMVEGLALGHKHAVILPMDKFPTGIMFHHHKDYMKRLRHKQEDPYGFHMCWTQGKPDKLKNLRIANMWYLTETCSSLPSLIPGGKVLSSLSARMRGTVRTGGIAVKDRGEWKYDLSSQCCSNMGEPGLDK